MGMTDYRTEQNEQGFTHSEEPAFPGLTVVNLKQEAASVDQSYKNFLVLNINNHCVRLFRFSFVPTAGLATGQSRRRSK